jgi:3-hydroxybutyrate dehydrogenase
MAFPPPSDASSRLRVLVTGGTGSLGEAMVAAFAKAGYQVFFQYCENESAAERLRSTYSSTGFRIDFTTPFSLPSTDFDVLVNNAGVNESEEPTHRVDPAVWEKMLHVNLTVPFLLIRSVVPGMVRRGWGRIVNIGSIFSLRAAAHRAPYVAAKHGLSGLTKTVAREYAAHGVTCNEICPSAVESRMLQRIAHDKARREGGTVAAVLAGYRALTPANRMAAAEEVASTSLYLCSSAAAFVNGASVPVDGGLLT